MPAGGCPLPIDQQPSRCKDCPLPVAERDQTCKWYRKVRRALSPLRMNIVSNGVLLLSFSITVLTNPNITDAQRNIAYASLCISAVLAVCALLPRDIRLLSRGWVYGGVSSIVFIAWFFTFAMKWLDGIKNTGDIEQWAVSVLGMVWLFSVLMILTRSITVVTLDRKSIRWTPLIIPLVMLWQTVIVFLGGNPIGGGVMVVFVIGSLAVALRVWRPVGELLIGTSR